jgi:hypothetical protein
MLKKNLSESGTTRQDEYKRPEKWVDGHRKHHNKRRVVPEYWYIMLLQNPKIPWIMWKPFPDRETCQDKIWAEFGNNSLFYPTKGKHIIKYGGLLSRTIRRKLGKVITYQDGVPDERSAVSLRKGLENH